MPTSPKPPFFITLRSTPGAHDGPVGRQVDDGMAVVQMERMRGVVQAYSVTVAVVLVVEGVLVAVESV